MTGGWFIVVLPTSDHYLNYLHCLSSQDLVWPHSHIAHMTHSRFDLEILRCVTPVTRSSVLPLTQRKAPSITVGPTSISSKRALTLRHFEDHPRPTGVLKLEKVMVMVKHGETMAQQNMVLPSATNACTTWPLLGRLIERSGKSREMV